MRDRASIGGAGKIPDSFGSVQNFHSQYVALLVVVEDDTGFNLIRESKFRTG